MSVDGAYHAITIDERLVNLDSTPIDQDCYVFKVHHRLREINAKAYEPDLLAIGPYHHGKDHLSFMEMHKLRFLHRMLKRRGENGAKRYITAMIGRISFVLDVNGSNYVSTTKHLLGLVHEAINPSSKERRPQKRSVESKETKKLKNLAHPNENEGWNSIPYATYFRMSGFGFHKAKILRDVLLGEVKAKREEWKPIPNVIELQEAGVKFKKAKIDNLFHIKFNNGVMEIPPLNIVDNTESVFRNLIAYEQHSQHIDLNYFTDFATLMDYLINTLKDVELLRRKGIINSWMGDDEVVSNMFNKFCSYTHFSKDFYYADIIKEAKLRHDYFNSPWALLSVLAAILLLLLAIAQTLFSILSYVVK
ncbi:hypothetical protein I3842_01G125100 [Carya illinoinensis]|uniref:Uncharacterized protein n=1 Tax=Carya illinoinensis TaxID=32201 RepID=A0A922FZP4_CARIL|nr:hypothetical protein I3842_01G125100 [Carya illinoinensis]